MLRCLLCSLAIVLMSAGSAAAVEEIGSPLDNFDILVIGQQHTFFASGLENGVMYFVKYEVKVSSNPDVWSEIGGTLTFSDNHGEISKDISLGTLGVNAVHDGRVRVLKYMGATGEPLLKVENTGTFRGPVEP